MRIGLFLTRKWNMPFTPMIEKMKLNMAFTSDNQICNNGNTIAFSSRFQQYTNK